MFWCIGWSCCLNGRADAHGQEEVRVEVRVHVQVKTEADIEVMVIRVLL